MVSVMPIYIKKKYAFLIFVPFFAMNHPMITGSFA